PLPPDPVDVLPDRLGAAGDLRVVASDTHGQGRAVDQGRRIPAGLGARLAHPGEQPRVLLRRVEGHVELGGVPGGQPRGPGPALPPRIWSTWATEVAGGPGRRAVPAVTIVPSRMREVSRARPARVSHASVGPGRPVPPIVR